MPDLRRSLLTIGGKLPKPLLGILVAATAGLGPASAEAFSPYLVVPDPAVAEASPAYRYANMTDAEALAELDRRAVPYTRNDPVPGVRAPVRLAGRLHGVHVHSALPPEQRATTPFEILDARLALALDDFCALLERHDVDEVVHYTMYRPNVPLAPDHGPRDEALAARPSGGRPRPAHVPGAPVAGAPAVRPAVPAIPGAPRQAAPAVSARRQAASAMGAAKQGMPAAGAPKQAARVAPGAPKQAPPAAQGLVKAPAARERQAPPAAQGPAKAPALGDKGKVDGKLTAAMPEGARHKRDDGAPKPEPGVVPGPGGKAPAAAPRAPVAPASAATRSAGARVARRDPEGAGIHRTTWAPPGTRHPAGLAIDVALLHRRDGRWISVQHDFHGRIGQRTCGEGAPMPESPDARELRALVCESSALGIFTYVLTPDYDAAHADHFHMEIKPGVRWFLYH